MEDSRDTLRDALMRHGITLPDDQMAMLQRYCQLLWEINRQLNLTRHTDYERFAGRDVVDSIEAARFIESGQRVLDVGTGGGVPGLILAIVRPDVRVELCESVGKKAKAVDAMASRLRLDVAVHHARAEQLLKDVRYDVAIARAIGPLFKILRWMKPYWTSVGKLILIKGPAWIDERHEARSHGLLNGLHLRRLASYDLRGTSSQGVILAIWPKAPKGLSG